MKFSISIFSIVLLVIMFFPNCFALEKHVTQTNIDTLVAGIYTSIEQINANEPLHTVEPQLVKYNTADIYFVKKIKLKLLKDVVALSNGKALYISIGNYKGKKGFIKSSFENWFNPSTKIVLDENKLQTDFVPGLYHNILNFKKPEISDAYLQFEKNGSKNIYSLKNYTNEQLSNIIAAVNGAEIYLVTGSYLNQIAFAKNQTKGRYFYFETPSSTIIEASSSTIFNAGVSNINTTELLQQPNLKKVGILFDLKTNQFNLLTNKGNKNRLIMLPIIKDNPRMLLQFISSPMQPEDCKTILQRINAFYGNKTDNF